jgi:hypothetical protein
MAENVTTFGWIGRHEGWKGQAHRIGGDDTRKVKEALKGDFEAGTGSDPTCEHRLQQYEGVSKSFRTGRLERELQMVQLSATRCSYIAIL